jgi:uncharacterized integral membrane protein
MLTLILILIIGLIFAYLSQSNFTPVTLHVGPYAFSDIPLFYVIVLSLILGLLFSYLIYLVHSISTSWKFRGKNHEIKKQKDEVLELTKRVHQL